jgi:hypothetical protein
VKILTVSLASVFLLTGCSALGGEESDSAACEELSLVVSATEVNLDNLTPAAVAETLRAQVQPLAGEGLATRIGELAAALEGAEIDAAAAGAAASAIGVQCMLNGVMFDFTGVGQLLQ